MDPHFNEACADALCGVTIDSYHYRLMTDGEKYQWRWVNPPPGVFGLGMSPEFRTRLEAVEWAMKRNTGDVSVEKSKWKPVDP